MKGLAPMQQRKTHPQISSLWAQVNAALPLWTQLLQVALMRCDSDALTAQRASQSVVELTRNNDFVFITYIVHKSYRAQIKWKVQADIYIKYGLYTYI